ncbi:hypothetical protein FNV43_RR04022 [Rhamnella rubrinervis]|uniref:Uncharacterized protein n=1 Tax=Rhamnella rubrinervis TaxID=2594499 RepID=A0A8K0HJ09_9ROSA|nr:hypothetical protein FNV43_RR04022 [Rhamnella rubrinervis]
MASNPWIKDQTAKLPSVEWHDPRLDSLFIVARELVGIDTVRDEFTEKLVGVMQYGEATTDHDKDDRFSCTMFCWGNGTVARAN